MNEVAEQPGTITLDSPSTVLDPQTVKSTSGGGQVPLTQPGDGLEDVLTSELAKLREADAPETEDDKSSYEGKKDAKLEEQTGDKKKEESKDKSTKLDDEKAKAEKAKRERAPDGKFAKNENKVAESKEQAQQEGEPDEAANGQDGSERSRQSESRQNFEPPARFLPKERENWANVPNSVKAAIARISTEYESEVGQYKASHEEWSKLDKFQKMASQHGATVYDALERYTNLDGLLQTNPIEGIKQILATRGITPEQYAHHVINNPDLHRAPANVNYQAPNPNQVNNSQDSELAERLARLEGELIVSKAQPIIQQFASSHPDYPELESKIVDILETGIIERLYGNGLSPEDKLAEAYRMAGGRGPSSQSQPEPTKDHSQAETRLVKPDVGKKSIRGALTDGIDPDVSDSNEDLDTFLRKQLRSMRA